MAAWEVWLGKNPERPVLLVELKMTYLFTEYENCKYWLEVDADDYASRQVVMRENGEPAASCREDCLAEGILDALYDFETISESDFEKIWSRATQAFREEWIAEKPEYAIGSTVSGAIKYFYPQGAVFDLENIQGCADVDGCYSEEMYPGRIISGTVTGYDDVNMWVLIGGCKIMPEPVRNITITRERFRFIGSLIKYYCIFNLCIEEFEEYIEEVNKKQDKGNHEVIEYVTERWDVIPISNGRAVEIKAATYETYLFAAAFTSTGIVLSNQITIGEGDFDLSYCIKTKYDFFKGTTLLISERKT